MIRVRRVQTLIIVGRSEQNEAFIEVLLVYRFI